MNHTKDYTMAYIIDTKFELEKARVLMEHLQQDYAFDGQPSPSDLSNDYKRLVATLDAVTVFISNSEKFIEEAIEFSKGGTSA